MSDMTEIDINGEKLKIFSSTTVINPYSAVEFQMALGVRGAIDYVHVYRIRGGEWTFTKPFGIGSAFLAEHPVDPF